MYSRFTIKYKTDIKFRNNIKNNAKEYNKKVKDIVYNALGGYQCSCPGIDCWHEGKCILTDKRCLQLDHRNGGGTQQIKDLKIYGKNKYLYFKRNIEQTKREMQVMCANCNWVKRHTNKEIGLGSY